MIFGRKPAALDPVHVALIDDEVDLCHCLALALEQHKLTSAAAYDGEAGLELIRARLPQLILLDIKMPRKNGYQVLMDLKKDPALAQIPVFVMTSLGDEGDKTEAEWAGRLGVVRFFAKPFDPEHIASAAAECLGAGQAG